jgi:pentafunctional AROM polypeptide
VNTLIRLPSGKIRGDNTDWLGIRACLLPLLRARASAAGTTAAGAGGLVLGAGGTARAALYALRSMGVSPIYAWNRTASKGAALAAEFGAEVRRATRPFTAPARRSRPPLPRARARRVV